MCGMQSAFTRSGVAASAYILIILDLSALIKSSFFFFFVVGRDIPILWIYICIFCCGKAAVYLELPVTKFIILNIFFKPRKFFQDINNSGHDKVIISDKLNKTEKRTPDDVKFVDKKNHVLAATLLISCDDIKVKKKTFSFYNQETI